MSCVLTKVFANPAAIVPCHSGPSKGFAMPVARINHIQIGQKTPLTPGLQSAGTAQRPPFRAAERFDAVVLAAIWSKPAHVRLQPAVRYTRPLWQFFCDHSSPVTAGMIESLGNGDHLPEGPEPEIHSLAADRRPSRAIPT